MKGIVVKGIGGFYFVKCGEELFRAKGRGILKKDKDILYVGDEVEAFPPEEGEDDGLITEIYPRKNCFQRPPVANIDKVLITVAAKSPNPNYGVIDRLLVMAENKGIAPIICVNKTDLDEDKAREIEATYKNLYPTVLISCKEMADDDIRRVFSEHVKDSRVALAGPSGVGKSTLINILIPDASMETGEVSEKGNRGKHTTRHVELFPLGEGFIYDTPGFTSLEINDMEEGELGTCFPEIHKASAYCRFGDCTHMKEPDCRVLKEVEDGIISESRYNSYLSCIEEIRKGNKYG